MDRDNVKRDQFFDKKDYQYIKVASDYDFYDLFTLPEPKFPIRIPETILMKGGKPAQWLFNTCKGSVPYVLKKNQSNIKLLQIVKNFLGVRDPSNEFYQLFQLLQFTMIRKSQKFFCFTKDLSGEGQILNDEETVKVMQSCGGLRLFQRYIKPKTKLQRISTQTLIAIYRRDELTQPVELKIQKQSTVV